MAIKILQIITIKFLYFEQNYLKLNRTTRTGNHQWAKP